MRNLISSHSEQRWNMLQQMLKCHIGNSSNHHNFFPKDGKLVYCNDKEGLMQEIRCTHNPEELHLSKYSLTFRHRASSI